MGTRQSDASATVRARRIVRTALGVALAATLTCSLVAPTARADDLTDQRERVKQQIARTKTDLSESTQSLSAAAVALDTAQGQLDEARTALARTRRELLKAQRLDRAMAAKLRKAQAALAKARAAVIAGQKKLDEQKAMAGEMVRDQYQQQTNLLPLAILVESRSTADLQTRLQWSTTMFDTTQAKIDRLTVLQAQLKADKAKTAKLEAEIAADRKTAAANLKTKRTLERRAATQTAAVASLVRQRQAAEVAATREVAADRSRYAQLTRERATVEQRIAVRIAKAKAEAARKAAAARAARVAAARAAAAERARERARELAQERAQERAAKRAAQRAHRKYHAPKKKKAAPAKQKASKPKHYRSSNSGMNGASHGFSFPVSAGITSPYGMRFHPVLKIWKLHDGTDFGAGCGTAIRAPYSGRVAEKYFNAGYGNRLMIDHGYIDGRYVTTGYNHAIRYTVGVGEHVSKGEVIGYVGTTGYSTGCHLHLMVWLDGSVRNPMTWF